MPGHAQRGSPGRRTSKERPKEALQPVLGVRASRKHRDRN
jgi:hypothetical protein